MRIAVLLAIFIEIVPKLELKLFFATCRLKSLYVELRGQNGHFVIQGFSSSLEYYVEVGVMTLTALLPLDFREPSGSSTELRWVLGTELL